MSFPDPKEYAKRTSRSPERKAYTQQWVKRLEEAVADLANWKDGKLFVGIPYDMDDIDQLNPARRKQVLDALVAKGYRVEEDKTVDDARKEPCQGFVVRYP